MDHQKADKLQDILIFKITNPIIVLWNTATINTTKGSWDVFCCRPNTHSHFTNLKNSEHFLSSHQFCWGEANYLFFFRLWWSLSVFYYKIAYLLWLRKSENKKLLWKKKPFLYMAFVICILLLYVRIVEDSTLYKG